jgi:hypothetical protein
MRYYHNIVIGGLAIVGLTGLIGCDEFNNTTTSKKNISTNFQDNMSPKSDYSEAEVTQPIKMSLPKTKEVINKKGQRGLEYIILAPIILSEIDRLEQKGLFSYAARIAKEAGMENLANQLYTRGINEEEQDEWFLYAARIAKEAGMEERARRLYEIEINEAEQGEDFGEMGYNTY